MCHPPPGDGFPYQEVAARTGYSLPYPGDDAPTGFLVHQEDWLLRQRPDRTGNDAATLHHRLGRISPDIYNGDLA
ncbi:hypothetical protein ASZ90_016433 [hydrocarbon metagenome]|uniref:Uncharacterized protein n=1 Tax=hydrocarbon metagenome TaxID=938273 RepID=A0A0W8EV56_9ZZZZ